MAIAASLIVRLSAQYGSFVRGMQQAEKSVTRFSKTARSLGREMSTEVTLPIVAFGALMFKAASDLERTEHAFEASFGAMADAARAWSETTAGALGVDADELRNSMSRFNQLAQSIGLTADTAALMSERLSQLTLDLVAFRNISAEEAATTLEGALAGRMKGLVRLGIVIKEADVEQTAMRIGMIRQGQTMTEQQATMARYITVMQKARVVQGEFARSGQTPAVLFFKLKQTALDVVETLGVAFMPVMAKAASVLLGFARQLQSLALAFGKAPVWLRAAAGGFAIFAAAIGPALFGLGTLLLMLPRIRRAWTLAFTPIGATSILVVAALVAMGAAVLAAADNWTYLKRQAVLAWAWIVDKVLFGVGAMLRGFAALAQMRGMGGLAAAMNRAADGVSAANERMLASTSDTITRMQALLDAEVLAAGGTGRMAGAGDGPRLLAEMRRIMDAARDLPDTPVVVDPKAKLRIFTAGLKDVGEAVTAWAALLDERSRQVEASFGRMAENITDSLTTLFSDVLLLQADAFKRFLSSIERMIADFAARMAVEQLGIALATKLLGGYSPLGSSVSGASARLLGASPTPARGDSFTVNVSFAPAFIDARSGAAWLRENESVITEAVINGVRKSGAARAALAGV